MSNSIVQIFPVTHEYDTRYIKQNLTLGITSKIFKHLNLQGSHIKESNLKLSSPTFKQFL